MPPRRAAKGPPASPWARRALALPGARYAPFPQAHFTPQLATHAPAGPPTGSDWLCELKVDGYRIQAVARDFKVRLYSRNGQDWTRKLPHLTAGVELLGLESAAFDGELVAGAGRREDFADLQPSFAHRADSQQLTFIMFDLLYLDGVSVEESPLRDRKRLLSEVLVHHPRGLAYSTHVAAADSREAFALACQEGFEGIVCKRGSRPYVRGRSDDWLKVKAADTVELAVVGYLPPEDGDGVRSLLVAAPDGTGGWLYAGRVGSGLTDRLVRELRPLLSPTRAKATATVAQPTKALARARWVSPRLVAEVHVRGITRAGVLRQPSLKGIRFDRSAKELQPGPYRSDS